MILYTETINPFSSDPFLTCPVAGEVNPAAREVTEVTLEVNGKRVVFDHSEIHVSVEILRDAGQAKKRCSIYA